MKLFKKSAMSLALGAAVTSGALMMGVSAPVQAVNIAQDGLGQVLVFPYYTTRNGWSTLFNVTNTSGKTVVAKVRWREGVNSRDVRDFNIVLSPYDVWTAVTRNTADGAEIVTPDNSCTFPKLEDRGGGLTGVKFTNLAYVKFGNQDNRDKGAEDLNRTREGYFEVIEMGVIDNKNSNSAEAGRIATNAKHSKAGGNVAFPKSCTVVRSVLRDPRFESADLDRPENVLKGRAILVKGAEGIAAGYDPLVLANFASSQIYSPPQFKFPDLGSGDAEAIIINDNDPENVIKLNPVSTPAVTTGQDAVSALISRSAVINDYNVTGDSQTDWVLTFPTKNFYVDRAFSATSTFAQIPFGGVAPLAPFATAVNGEAFSSRADGKSCFDVNVSMWDREEFDAPDETIEDEFSPREPGTAANQNRLCYEANILSFGDSDLFGSNLQKSLFKGNEAGLPGLSGWAKVTFGKQGAALPVTGMRVEIRNRGDATVNYGLANDHAYMR